MAPLDLTGTPLFEGLDRSVLEDIAARMRPRRFEARDLIYRQGEPGTSLFVIQDGVAVVQADPQERARPLAHLRRGDVVGEMSLVTGEPRSATVVAMVPTQVLELDQPAFARLVAEHPVLLVNLSRILSRRLARTSARVGRGRGAAVALLVGRGAEPLLPQVIEAARRAGPRSVACLELQGQTVASASAVTLPQALTMLDDLLARHATVVLTAAFPPDGLDLLLAHVDRAVVVLAPGENRAAAARIEAAGDRLEAVLVDPGDPRRGVARLGRQLTRTRLGLVLGAGGAKGYAHVGVHQVLEEAGYTIDCVAGSSVGALVGAWIALGMSAAEVEATMRRAFSPERVAEMLSLNFAGTSNGVEGHQRMCRETTHDCTFADLAIPFTATAVDLNRRQAVDLREGPVWEALVASTALPGLFPPEVRGAQRLVDGLALAPVPTEALTAAGADVTVSVNLMSRETLASWPGTTGAAPGPPRRTTGTLDLLLEVLDLAHLDQSVRQAAGADVVITPRFGPSSWRDFQLAELFLVAGREAAKEQLPALRDLARPQSA